MFTSKGTTVLAGAFQHSIKMETFRVWGSTAMICYQPKIRIPSLFNSFVRYGSSRKGKNGKDSQLVKLAHQAYATPFKSEETIPIIIVHGLLGAKSNWNSMAKALLKSTNNRMVVAVDNRNHGDSPHSDEFSYEIMVSDLMKFLQDKSIEKASLIGHSLGGRVCMLLALMYPQVVESLVVVDISPTRQSPQMVDLQKIFRLLQSIDLHPHLILSEARRQANAHLKQHGLDDKLISFLLTNLVETERHTNWRWKFNLKSITKNFQSEVCRFPLMNGSFEKRTLFLAGGDSDYLTPEDEPQIKSLFPAAEFVYIPGAGHWVHAEKPQEFLKIVSEFLNKDPR